jgi:hypothetical protein
VRCKPSAMRVPLALFPFVVLSLAACGDGGGGDEADVAEALDVRDDGAPPEDAPGELPEADVRPEDVAEADVGEEDAAVDVPDVVDVEDVPEETDEGGSPRTGCIEGTFQAYYGNLHAHTSNSDGEGSPSQAYAYARDVGLLDIMVVTDHLEQLYLGLSMYADCKADADAANVDGSYVALCGFEYGSAIDSLFRPTGHNNVFFSADLFPAVQFNFRDFYRTFVGCPECVGSFNHPGDGAEHHWSHFEYYADVDERMNLWEMNSDPAWNMLFQALDMGWHVSPTYNQDNHSANWGTANENRSGFWMTALDRASLKTAMLERRSFSTQDRNASIRMLADGACWMGSILGGTPSLELQVEAADEDAAETFATIELYGPGQVLLETFDCAATSPCTATFPQTITTPTYFVARAIETDGNVLVAAPIWAAP